MERKSFVVHHLGADLILAMDFFLWAEAELSVQKRSFSMGRFEVTLPIRAVSKAVLEAGHKTTLFLAEDPPVLLPFSQHVVTVRHAEYGFTFFTITDPPGGQSGDTDNDFPRPHYLDDSDDDIPELYYSESEDDFDLDEWDAKTKTNLGDDDSPELGTSHSHTVQASGQYPHEPWTIEQGAEESQTFAKL
jgi:hypothetical protein